MELNREEIGKRLKEFASSRFILLKEFSYEIGVASSNLKTHYFSGKSLPGAEMIAKLMSLGCDIHWLFYGEYQDITKKESIEYKVKKLESKLMELEKENEILRNNLGQISAILKNTKKEILAIKGTKPTTK